MRRSNRQYRERRLIAQRSSDRRCNCKGRRRKGRRHYEVTSGRYKTRASIRTSDAFRLLNGRLTNDVEGELRTFSRRDNSAQGRLRCNTRLSARAWCVECLICRFLAILTERDASATASRGARRRELARRARFLLRTFHVGIRFIGAKSFIRYFVSSCNG